MPKVIKKKATKNLDEDQPVITVVDKTEEQKPKKGQKRAASTSMDSVKKIKTVTDTQEIDEEEMTQPLTMTLKESDRLSAKGEKATLKLVSWNINGIRGWLTNGGLKYIDQEQPDMICFQVEFTFFFFYEYFQIILFRK
jgi:hypothetical protein